MPPSSSLMRETDSHDSYDPPMPYDTPPDYASPPLRQGSLGQDDDETPLIVHQKRRGVDAGPMDVNGFVYELGRLSSDVDTLRTVLKGVQDLRSEAVALSPEDSKTSTLEALARRTTSASLLLSTSIPSLRTLSTTINYLKPGAGSFVVSSAQSVELQEQLAQTVDSLKSALSTITRLEKEEIEEQKEARMRLLRVIKANEKERASQAELMALLLSAEREGSKPAEQLEVGSYAWRWTVEKPGTRLARCIDDAGDMAFLSKVGHPKMPAPSLWSDPWSYVPTLYTSSTRKVSGYSAAGTKESMPIDGSRDEEAIGSYGEPLVENRTPQALDRWRLWIFTVIVLAVLAAGGIGVALWSSHHNRATASGGNEEGAMSTFVQDMVAHPTPSLSSLSSLLPSSILV